VCCATLGIGSKSIGHSCSCSQSQTYSESLRFARSEHTIDALTLLLSRNPPPATPAPRPQEILHFYPHPRLPSSPAASCVREGRLVHRQQGSIAIGQQVRARWLPTANRLRPVPPPHALLELPQVSSSSFARAPRTWRHTDKWGTAKGRVAHDYSAGDAHQSAVRLVTRERSPGGPENGIPTRAVTFHSSVTEFVQIFLTFFAFKKVCHDTYYKSRFFL
jgi:hypothetical protein